MNTLVVIEYDDPYKAEEIRLKLIRMQKDYLLDLEDAVVVVKDPAGKVKLHQAINLTAHGAMSGGFWGALIGLIFLNPLLGVAMGMTAGAVSGALTDVGINDNFMKDLAKGLPTRELRAVRPGPEGHPGSRARGAQGDGRQGPEDVAHARERDQAPGGPERLPVVGAPPRRHGHEQGRADHARGVPGPDAGGVLPPRPEQGRVAGQE